MLALVERCMLPYLSHPVMILCARTCTSQHIWFCRSLDLLALEDDAEKQKAYVDDHRNSPLIQQTVCELLHH